MGAGCSSGSSTASTTNPRRSPSASSTRSKPASPQETGRETLPVTSIHEPSVVDQNNDTQTASIANGQVVIEATQNEDSQTPAVLPSDVSTYSVTPCQSKMEMNSIKIEAIAHFPDVVQKMLCGRPCPECILDDKTIRIYHIISYKEYRDIQDILWDQVYPTLSQECLEKGCELQIIDFTWGMPDQWADDHVVRKIQQNHIPQIMKSASSTIFTVFLDEICEDIIYPYSVLKEDFDSFLDTLQDESQKELLQKWYSLQEHDVMTSYTLRPITDYIKSYGSGKINQYEEGCKTWRKVEIELTKVFSLAGQEFADKYFITDLEKTLEQTVLSGVIPKENIIWVRKRRDGEKDSLEEIQAIEERNHQRYKTLCNRLKDVVDPASYIELSSTKGQKEEHDVAMRHLAVYREVAEKIISDLTKYDSNRVVFAGKGLPIRLYDELLHQTVALTKILDDVVDSLDIPESLMTYISDGKAYDEFKNITFVGDEEVVLTNGIMNCESYRNIDPEMLSDRDSKISNTSKKLECMTNEENGEMECNEVKQSPVGKDLESIKDETESQREHRDTVTMENNKNIQIDSELCDDDNLDAEALENEDPDVIRPLVLTGGVGCGKTSTCALLTTKIPALENWSNAVCIYRNISTDDRQSVLEVVASVMQQLCLMCSLHLSLSYKSLISHPEVFRDILKEVPVEMRVLIVLDGCDRLSPVDNKELEWLPKQLPFHIRLILTMTKSCTMFKSVKTLFPKTCFHIHLPNLPVEIAQEVFNRELEKQPVKLPQEINDKAIELVGNSANPLHARLLAVSCSLWMYEDVQNALCNNVSDQIAVLLEYIQLKMGLTCCGHLLTCITDSCLGLSDVEVMDIITGDLQFLKALYCYIKPEQQCSVPLHIWYQAKSVLEVLFTDAVIYGTRVFRWSHGVIGDVVYDMYDLGIFTSVRSLMLEYFTDKWSSGPPETSATIRTLTKRHPRQYNDHLNHRRLVESTWLMLTEHCIEELDLCIFDIRFLCDKLRQCGLFRVMDDVRRMLQLVPSDEDVTILQQCLHHCSSTLGEDAVHLPTLLHLLEKEGEIQVGSNTPKIINMLEAISEDTPVPQLVPSNTSIVQTFTLSNWQESKDTPPKWQHLFRIPDHPHHMISLSTHSGDLIIWDIINLTAIRKITSLRLPRDIRLICGTHAVVLCDRELRVVNLDEGKLETKLKGVLNLKMPYYSIHNKDHVIALSRNRMYVNLINTNSGDTVTTFKAGEDRFLNSLLVSADGMTCVCGDEVQKPFPLLVWDLRNRKLIHDLRIHGHEFLTKMAAITDEGHYVVCVSKGIDDDLPSFLIVYDLQSGTLFKKWRPTHNVTSVAISSKSNIVVSAEEDGTIAVWDLVGGTLRHEMKGPIQGANRLSLDIAGNTCISWDDTGQDTTLWMWDIAHGVCLGAFPSEVGFSCCELSADGSTVVVGVKGCDEIITFKPQNLTSSNEGEQTRLFGDSSRLGAEFCISDT